MTVRDRLRELRTSPIAKLAPREDATLAQRVRDMTPANTYQPPPPEEPPP